MLGSTNIDLARAIVEERTRAMADRRAARTLRGTRAGVRHRIGRGLVGAGEWMLGTIESRARAPEANAPC